MKKALIILALFTFPAFVLTYCTKSNQVIGGGISDITNIDTLYSVSGTPTFQPQAAPGGYATAWNGDISAWANTPKLTVLTTVPNPGQGVFAGFIGNTDSVSMQSMYDANNVYFLFQWTASTQNCASSPWYYSSTSRKWAQEAGAPTPISSGNAALRPAFIQDEFVIAFNISCPTFATLSCYASCHAYSAYGTTDSTPGAAMWTNGPSEYLDCWRARTLQTLNTNQANDNDINNGLQSNAAGELNKQFVTADPQVNSTDGGFSNKQTLTVTGTTTTEAVPMFVYPAGTYAIYPNANSVHSNGAILLSDTSTKAIRVTAVDSNGVLTLKDGTTIDPRTAASGNKYQQVGMGDGLYCIPGSVVSPYTGDRADVTANMYWTGNGWRLLLVRALNTNHPVNTATGYADDVTFSPSTIANYPFGFGIMFNGADNEHAIANGLTLHFKK